MRQVEELREARERQKGMVEAIVSQRDMYRTLLAQATPLPAKSSTVGDVFNFTAKGVKIFHCDLLIVF